MFYLYLPAGGNMKVNMEFRYSTPRSSYKDIINMRIED